MKEMYTKTHTHSAYSPVSLIARNNLRCQTGACTVIVSRRNLLQQEDSLPLEKSISCPEITLQSAWPVMRRLVLETCASITTCFISVLCQTAASNYEAENGLYNDNSEAGMPFP